MHVKELRVDIRQFLIDPDKNYTAGDGSQYVGLLTCGTYYQSWGNMLEGRGYETSIDVIHHRLYLELVAEFFGPKKVIVSVMVD